jgi:N-acetylglutamate synthase-like GNAT family acetyltransferase
MAESAKQRGTGIAYRSPEYISEKMREGKAIIATHKSGAWAGFCYIETWSHGQFVANSGLIVHPDYRKEGLAREIKKRIFELSRQLYPEAKIFGLTTGLAVMKINSELGYEPVTYSELTQDENFWSGCQSCVNFDILTAKERKVCLCTAMLFDPANHQKPNKEENFAEDLKKRYSLYERWMKFKTLRLSNIRILREKKNGNPDLKEEKVSQE